MEEIARALNRLAESNDRLLGKLEEVKMEIVRDREEKVRKAARRSKNSMEMDIEFIMKWESCDRKYAVDKLKYHFYNVGRVIRGKHRVGLPDGWKEAVLLHYEHKKNRQIIEGW